MLGSLPNIGNTENIHQQTFFWKQGIRTNPQIFLVLPSEESNVLTHPLYTYDSIITHPTL
mgnify:CR=1 FL=1